MVGYINEELFVFTGRIEYVHADAKLTDLEGNIDFLQINRI